MSSWANWHNFITFPGNSHLVVRSKKVYWAVFSAWNIGRKALITVDQRDFLMLRWRDMNWWVTDSHGTPPSKTEVKGFEGIKEWLHVKNWFAKYERKGMKEVTIARVGNFQIQNFRNEVVLSTIVIILSHINYHIIYYPSLPISNYEQDG